MNTNCPNCGAPFKDGVCEHCGTKQQQKAESYIHMDATGIRFGVVVVGSKNKIKL